MVEHEFLVCVAVYILVIELSIEIFVDTDGVFLGLSPYVVEFCASRVLIGFALLRKAFYAEDFGGGVSFRPFTDEDVVLVVWRCNVGDAISEGFNFGADFGSKGCGGKYC